MSSRVKKQNVCKVCNKELKNTEQNFCSEECKKKNKKKSIFQAIHDFVLELFIGN